MHSHYHFIGIGGIGMSALAHFLLQKGISVSGSDICPSYITDQLQSSGAKIAFGHARENIQNSGAVVYNTQIKESNPEVQQAREWGLPFLHRSDLLRQLMRGYRPLLVAGAHGKTTTSSLLTHLLSDAKLQPAFAVGGVIKSLGLNGGFGKGPYFVGEADESDGSFLKYKPYGAILTNIDNDHLDYWGNVGKLIEGFKEFADGVESAEHFFWCGDDERLRSLNLTGYSYGFAEENELRIHNFRQEGWSTFFDLAFEGNHYGEVELPLIGAHNVLNAAAVFGMGIKIGISEEGIRKGFSSFKGISRRAEFKGECRQISIFDDYAHHPTEIFATLRAVKKAVGNQRLITTFQPHRYTRTRDCFNEFAPAFECSDVLILTDIYSAGENPIDGVTAQTLLEKIRGDFPREIHYVPRNELENYLVQSLHPTDILLTIGAGDITQVGPEILKKLEQS